ncbi:MAG: response regulator [Clostridia bacterium]|nr:response regulator [Clostridia bacterium]
MEVLKVLIVDDERIEREALRHFFKTNDLGMEVVGEASNGVQAIEMNQALHPDLIIMDIRMGILDGLKATECIKRSNPQVEIIILTAFGLFEYSQQALKCRVFDYLLKPVEEKELFASIQRVKNHILIRSKGQNKQQSADLIKCWLEEQGDEEKEASYGGFEDPRVSRLVDYIMSNLEKDLTLSHLASLVHLNTSYLSRLFKSNTGVSLSNFIREARIEKAKSLLKTEKNKPLKAIAEEVGFSDIHHFCNTFNKTAGMTPAEFRTTGKVG